MVPRVRPDQPAAEPIDEHYEVDEAKRTVAVTEAGVELVEDQLGVENLYETANTPLVGFLNNSIRAKELYQRDRDYVILRGEVVIVDENTGRTLVGRRYNEGLHQALEAKEGVEIKAENQTLATITLQNYFRQYETLSGMTGTAKTEESEFSEDLRSGRRRHPDQPRDGPATTGPTSSTSPRTRSSRAAVDDIAERAQGRSSRSSSARRAWRSPRRVSELLRTKGVRHEVLNAKAARARGAHRRRRRAEERGHRRDEHGRARHRHHARRESRRSWRSGGCAARASPPRTSGGPSTCPRALEETAGRGRGREGRGGRRGRAVRPRHRAARLPAHRQPAARAVRAARATRGRAGSTCRSRTTSCAGSTPAPST